MGHEGSVGEHPGGGKSAGGSWWLNRSLCSRGEAEAPLRINSVHHGSLKMKSEGKGQNPVKKGRENQVTT